MVALVTRGRVVADFHFANVCQSRPSTTPPHPAIHTTQAWPVCRFVVCYGHIMAAKDQTHTHTRANKPPSAGPHSSTAAAAFFVYLQPTLPPTTPLCCLLLLIRLHHQRNNVRKKDILYVRHKGISIIARYVPVLLLLSLLLCLAVCLSVSVCVCVFVSTLELKARQRHMQMSTTANSPEPSIDIVGQSPIQIQ